MNQMCPSEKTAFFTVLDFVGGILESRRCFDFRSNVGAPDRRDRRPVGGCAVYEPTAIVFLSRQAGMELPEAAKMASYGTGLLSIGTILGCIAAPWLAERLGRRSTLALYYFGMMVTIALAFGWAFYLPTGSALPTFMAVLFFLGVFGGNFAIFSLWLPELFGTEARATAFAFCTSIGRFIGAGVNFGLAGAVAAMGTLGTPIALTSIAFAIGLLIIPFAHETRGETLPE
jgi:MFS family permease